ncbi:MAG: AhpC/TSA family protein [Bacteroidales bacterium]|nr:AhpC/TSA family protein [Bacteroidales bacterium]
MKKIIYFIAGVLFLSACTSKSGYKLSGTIDGLASGDIVLLEQRIDKEYVKIDSVTSPDASFEFSGSVEIPDVYYVSVPGKRGKAMIFLENSQMGFTAHADTLWKPAITGSAVHDEYSTFQESLSEIYAKARELYSSYQEAERAGDEDTAKKIGEKMDAVYDEVEEYQQAYLDENPASYIAPYIVQNLHYGKEADEIEDMLAKLDPSLQASSLVGNVTRTMEILKNVAIGMPAPDFTQNDSLGNPVSLSSFRGKYLLIDFWAAWCGPCRAENPNVVKAYEKYADKGFEILGVSLDHSRDNWLKAVKDDGLTWTQLSDLKYWSNEVAALYGIVSIPGNLLLDPDGVIIRKQLRGDDLHSALEELMP